MTSLERSRPGSAADDTRVADAEDHQQALVRAQLLDDRVQLLLEIPLELVGHIRDLRLRVLLRELQIALRLLDVLFELRRAPGRS